MRATGWEFKNRALIFGILIGAAFGLYFLDAQNVTAAFANALERRYGLNADVTARLLFFVATLMVALAALLRTWASAYLQSNVVYAADVKTAALVGDGPYRRARNPLYLANILMMTGIGSMMSRAGFVFGVVAMAAFCYRLIFREEDELGAAQATQYAAYRSAVPRMWPSFTARLPAGAQRPNWRAGFKAESWYWGFPIALLAFAVTLQLKWFFIGWGAAVGSLAGVSFAAGDKSASHEA